MSKSSGSCTDTAKKLATKVKILTQASVECEPGRYATYGCRTEEERAKELQRWCKDFNAFIRDHRHQDETQVSVRLDYQDQCSACFAQWEPYKQEEDDDPYEKGKTYCAACGTEVSA